MSEINEHNFIETADGRRFGTPQDAAVWPEFLRVAMVQVLQEEDPKGHHSDARREAFGWQPLTGEDCLEAMFQYAACEIESEELAGGLVNKSTSFEGLAVPMDANRYGMLSQLHEALPAGVGERAMANVRNALFARLDAWLKTRKPTIKRGQDLDPAEAQNFISDLQNILYREKVEDFKKFPEDGEEIDAFNPGKEWDSDQWGGIYDLMQKYGLAPTGIVPIDEDEEPPQPTVRRDSDKASDGTNGEFQQHFMNEGGYRS